MTAEASSPETSVTPILWTDPGPLARRDLFWGNGAPDRVPQHPFTFVEESASGTTPKLVVTDARGVTWGVKFTSEAHSEVAAARLLWAFGYLVQEMYYVHTGTIAGAEGLGRARDLIGPDGTFWEARFQRRDPEQVEQRGWTLDDNPFTGTRELSGLLTLFAITNNWDTDFAKNQAVFAVATERGVEDRYMAVDIGATFGRFDPDAPIKWNLEEYRQDRLIAAIEPDAITLNYRAYGTPSARVPMEHARWFAAMARDLAPSQVRMAFEAAGTPPADVTGFVEIVMSKFRELQAAVRP
jgi:hypothetical protein